AAPALPGNIKGTLRCARAPSSALRAPSPVNGRRASFPTLAARLGISPSPAQREKSLSPRKRGWREAPDEGASAASCSWLPGPSRLPAVTIADRIPPFAPERPPRHLRPRRGLVALPFAGAHQAQDAVDGGRVEAGGDDLVAGLVLVDVAQQDRVEHVVG